MQTLLLHSLAGILLGAICHPITEYFNQKEGGRGTPRFAPPLAGAILLPLLLLHNPSTGTAFGLAFYLALMIIASFIDIRHKVISDEISMGGAIALITLVTLQPQILATSSHFEGFLRSLGGGLAGALLILAIIQFGKMAYGTETREGPIPFSLSKTGLTLDGQFYAWDEFFFRSANKVTLTIGESPTYKAGETLILRKASLTTPTGETPREQITSTEGTLSHLISPREAMGFGDLKLMMAIGAFCGWQGALFTIFAGAVIGCLIVLPLILLSKSKEPEAPFGPFLALGSIAWLTYGPEILRIAGWKHI